MVRCLYVHISENKGHDKSGCFKSKQPYFLPVTWLREPEAIDSV